MVAILTAYRRLGWRGNGLKAALIAIISLLFTLPVLKDYIAWGSANFIVGCIALPLMLQPMCSQRASFRFSIVSLLFCALYIFLPVKTCLYVALISSLLGLWESQYGKTSVLPALTLLLMSPVATSFADTFSFPIRLRLTNAAGAVLNIMGTKSAVAGNVISCSGVDFSVDPACMGLHMLVTSLLCVLLLTALLQRRSWKYMSFGPVILLLSLTVVLNIVANIMRIVLLVFFRLLPDNPLHEITGILCLIIYILLPAYWLIKLTLKRAPQKPAIMSFHTGKGAKSFIVPVLALITLSATATAVKKNVAGHHGSLPHLTGYESSWYDAEIAQLKSPRTLIYIKQLRGFYFTEHNPMLCWIGSGYEFGKVEHVSENGLTYYTGILQKKGERLYTAWWYDNGLERSDGVSWRLKALKSSHDFSLINVTSGNADTLHAEILKLAASAEVREWLGRKGGNK